jgi:hypothetical protein
MYHAALAMFISQNPLGARLGDVITFVDDRGGPLGIGLKEAKLFVWVPVAGMTQAEAETLSDGIYVDQKRLILLRKYSHQVLISELNRRLPTFDVMRAIDKQATYQPFLNPVNEKLGLYKSRLVESKANLFQRKEQ